MTSTTPVSSIRFTDLLPVWKATLFKTGSIDLRSAMTMTGDVDQNILATDVQCWGYSSNGAPMSSVVTGFQTSPTDYRIRGLWVKKDQINLGIGSDVAVIAEHYAASLGCTHVWDAVPADRVAMMQALGYAVAKLVSVSGQQLTIMVKNLVTMTPQGVVILNTPGRHTFVVPDYQTSLVVELWGGGASGAGVNSAGNTLVLGTDGGDTRFEVLAAHGGKHCASIQVGGLGGTGTGGDVSTSGNPGAAASANAAGAGGDSPNGGTGGPASVAGSWQAWGAGGPGVAPGAGGGGAWAYTLGGINQTCAGGGAGGYVKKTYPHGALRRGRAVRIEIGQGGQFPIVPGNAHGGNGATGQIKITTT